MATPNWLLGKGEELTTEFDHSGGGGQKLDPYGLDEQKREIGKRAAVVAMELKALPAAACPNDEAVAVLTLHPTYLAKTSFPKELLNRAGLRTVGSRQRVVTPRKIASTDENKQPQPTTTADIFVAGPRKRFEALANAIPGIEPQSALAGDLIKIEDFRVIPPKSRIQIPRSKEQTALMEFVLHTGGPSTAESIRTSFKSYLATLGIDVDLSKRIDAGQLSFIAVRAPRSKMVEAAKFSFLRTSRDMPRLRQFTPTKPNGFDLAFSCSLPSGEPIDATIRVAVFDGGIPNMTALNKCVILDESATGLADAVSEYKKHGLAVTSALLFGPLRHGRMAPQPYATVHHFRVLDVNTALDPQDELYPVLRRIVSVLEREKNKPTFEFVALSIGPDIPLDDEEVHPWTAKLDELMADGKTLACVAAGNTGEADTILGYDRIQPPADAVNVLAVGACTSDFSKWQRAKYSSVGYGRAPGFIKPDGVAFGGTEDEPFWVLDVGTPLVACGERGTSFASPYVLRSGIGVRAQMGAALNPLAIRALLVHKCERNARAKAHKLKEVGWGRFCTDVDQLMACADSGATVVYQGVLNPRKVLRAEIPMPGVRIEGKIRIAATICFVTDTDPQDAIHYTRSSVVATFRKDKNNIPPEAHLAEADSFFGVTKWMKEVDLRKDAGKWETTLNKAKTFDNGSDLRAPVFDLHYNPREAGQDAKSPKSIPYAMVVSVSSPDFPDMFNHIWNRYRHKLQQLQPRYRVIAGRS